MTKHVVNMTSQTPAVLDVSVVHDDVAADFDPVAMVSSLVSEQVIQPTTTLSVDGTDIDKDGLTELVTDCLDDAVNAEAEDVMEQVLVKGLLHYDASWGMPVRRCLVVQEALRLNLPKPDARTAIYTAATDVIPAAKSWLVNPTKDATALLFASTGLTYDLQTLGICVRSQDEFLLLAERVKAFARAHAADIDPKAQILFDQFAKLDVTNECVLPLRLRVNSADGNDPYSFQRVLAEICRDWSASKDGRLLPFDVGEAVVPTSLCIVNVDRIAHSDPSVVNAAWGDVVKALRYKVTTLSQSKLHLLDEDIRRAKKAQADAAADIQANLSGMSKKSHRPFRSSQGSVGDLARAVTHILKGMADVNRSQNAYKTRHHTFARANRRRPEDCDRPGVSTAISYKPDIHLYVDTSGSITEENYEAAVKAIIALARRLDVNMYFTSFSDYMTAPALLHMRGRSVRQIYAEVERLDKASGGTNFYQIWRYINCSQRRQRELSLVITDFGYVAPNAPIEHPKNLFYAPCSVDPSSWPSIVKMATHFMESMRYIEPNVREHMLL